MYFISYFSSKIAKRIVFVLLCNHPISNNCHTGRRLAVDFGCCLLCFVSLGKVAGLCRALNTQIVVNTLQHILNLASCNGRLLLKSCVYHFYDFILGGGWLAFRQRSTNVAYVVFQCLHFVRPQFVVSLFYQRIFKCYLSA